MWLPSDTRAALEWQHDHDLRCSGCGLSRVETMSREEDGPDFKAEMWRCRACEATEALSKSYAENGGAGSGAKFTARAVRS